MSSIQPKQSEILEFFTVVMFVKRNKTREFIAMAKKVAKSTNKTVIGLFRSILTMQNKIRNLIRYDEAPQTWKYSRIYIISWLSLPWWVQPIVLLNANVESSNFMESENSNFARIFTHHFETILWAHIRLLGRRKMLICHMIFCLIKSSSHQIYNFNREAIRAAITSDQECYIDIIHGNSL